MPSLIPVNLVDTSTVNYAEGPRLLADIGGTNARFALERAPGRIEAVEVLPCADYPDLVSAIDAYGKSCGNPVVRHAAIAIANPVQGDHVSMTNHHWAFSIEATRRHLGLDVLLVVNDFTALARAIPQLEPHEYQQVGGGAPRSDAAIGLVGAGTGLGVGGLIPKDGAWHTLDSEGGHVSFSPSDEREVAVLEYCWRTYSHVSAERLVSGPGIEIIYRALTAVHTGSTAFDVDVMDCPDTPEIVRRGLDGEDALCREVLDCFCAMLGTVASNLAVTLGALGGIYIGGGVVPRLGEFFMHSPFRERFEKKGRFGKYLSQVPTYVITADYPALTGVAKILADHLDGNAGGVLLDRISKIQSHCSPAERKVAMLTLSHPRVVVGEPIAEIAPALQRALQHTQSTSLPALIELRYDGNLITPNASLEAMRATALKAQQTNKN